MSIIYDAQHWHDEDEAAHLAEDDLSTCWCCCPRCKRVNPYYEQAARRIAQEQRTAQEQSGLT